MAEAHSTTNVATCSTEYFSARVESLREALSTVDVNEDEARVDAEIEASKAHWSELKSAHVTAVEVQAVESSSTSTSEPSSSELEEMSEVETVLERNERVAKDNVEVFRSLQARYPGGFFIDDNDVGFDHIHRLPGFLVDEDGKPKAMEVKLSSEKPFAEGAQAQLFHAHMVSHGRVSEKGMVMKVFKEGTSLRDLQRLLSPSMLNDKLIQDEGWFHSELCISIFGARLLKADGRFAFLMWRAWGDLRKLINTKMLHNNNQGAPFSDEVAHWCMLCIAWGMRGLHAKGIVHRDLKAANVLVVDVNYSQALDPLELNPSNFRCYIADYECSVGVVGTRFWRAPEILVALKDRNIDKKPEVFSKQADVYSFGMTCYEILTGHIPFEELRVIDYNRVISGARPILPKQTPSWMVDMVTRCWDKDFFVRPTFDEILSILGSHKK